MGIMILVAVLVISFACVAGAFFAIFRRSRIVYSKEELADIVPLLLPVDMERMESYFDAGAEWSLRLSSDPRDFRSLQRSRRKIAIAHIRRSLQNAMLLRKLGQIAFLNRDVEQMQLGKALMDAYLPVRAEAVFLIAVLSLQRFVRPSSSLSAAGEIFRELSTDYAILRHFAVELVHRRDSSFDAQVARLL